MGGAVEVDIVLIVLFSFRVVGILPSDPSEVAETSPSTLGANVVFSFTDGVTTNPCTCLLTFPAVDDVIPSFKDVEIFSSAETKKSW